MTAEIQRILRKDLRHLTGLKQDEKVEKAMANYEELRQVDKDHREMMDEFLNSAKEARALLEPGTDGSPKTEATTISKVKGMITSFQQYKEVLQTKAALIKKLWWRAVTCKTERDVVWLIQDFDLLGADCERLEKDAADNVAIGVARAAAQNASVPPVAMMVDVSKYVPVPFTGTGEPQTLLQEFRNWKGRWSLAERKLRDSPHITDEVCLLYTSPSPRDRQKSRMPSSA